MEYNFTERDEFNFNNHFYPEYVKMLKIVDDNVCMSKDRIIKIRESEKRKSIKEFKFSETLISRILVSTYLKSPYRKHMYELYDLMLLVLRELNTDVISISALANLDVKEFYVKYLKERYDELDQIQEKIHSMDYDSAKREGLHDEYYTCLRNIIPSFEEEGKTIN